MRIITKTILNNASLIKYLFCLVSALFISTQPCCGVKPIISAQTGDHPDYFRVSFTWPDPVRFDYKVTPSGLEVRFFHAAELLLDRLVRIFPGSSYRQEADQTVLTIRVSPNRKVEARAYGNVVYLDIYKKQEAVGVSLAYAPSNARLKHQPVTKFDAAQLADIDLQNLFRRVADYLGHAEPNTLSNIVALEKDILLLKFPDAPIAVYELKDNVNIVVLSKETPIIDKNVTAPFSVETNKFDKGFVLHLPKKNFMIPNVTKVAEGWCIEFNRSLPQGETPLLFAKSSEKSLAASRAGLFDPVNVEGIQVCCTLDPNVFVPFQLTNGKDINIIATTAGAAFKLDPLSLLTLDRDRIVLAANEGISLPQDQPQRIRFNITEVNAPPFFERKKQLLEQLVASNYQAPSQHLDLILFYLAHGFSTEAAAEIESYAYLNPERDLLHLTLLHAIAVAADNTHNYEVIEKLFPESKNNIEAAAWYAFVLSKLTSVNMPSYLTRYLMEHIRTFPNPLKSVLLLDFADQMIRQNVPQEAEEALATVSDRFLIVESLYLKQFLQHKIRKLKGQPDNPFEVQRLLRYVGDPALTARIIIEEGLIDLKKQDHHQFVDTLESLLPLIEGNIMHLKVTDYLLNYYSDQKDYLAVLDKAIILQANYPRTYTHYKPKIQNIIERIVRNKLYEKIGAIQTVHIFNQFVDAIPPHVYMIDFILDLTRKVHLIGILTEATQLLENYIRRTDVRLTSQKQMSTFLQLLDFYIKSKDEVKAQQLISIIERRALLTKEDIEMVHQLKARLALSKGNSDEALQLLEATHSFEGLRLKSGLLWTQRRWPEAADTLVELLDKHPDQMDEERKERYIVHLAAALVLNEKHHASKRIGRGKTSIRLQEAMKKYAAVISKYSVLFQELTTLPYNSVSDVLTKQLIENELNETDRLEKLFDHVKAIPTH